MRSHDDLRETLHELAGQARDVPDMPVTRAVPPRQRSRLTPVLLTAGLLVAVLAVSLLGVSLPTSLPLTPASGPTRAVPPPSSAASSPTPSSPAPPSTSRPRAAMAPHPLTEAEITAATARCLRAGQGSMNDHRQGKLEVRYAMVQAAVGYPMDSSPRPALLLEDDGGYFDCSQTNGELWVGKGGDHFGSDESAAGFELPTLTGGSTPRCNPAAAARVDSVIVLRTSPGTVSARLTVRARGGTRTATVPTRNGFVYLNAQVNGKAAWHSWTTSVELLDASGRRLRIQPYAGSVTRRLAYPLEPCVPDTDR